VSVLGEQLTPTQLADRAEHWLERSHGPGDVDAAEHLNANEAHEAPPKDRWLKTMNPGGLPWEWTKLDHAEKTRFALLCNR
jgi:hypothetical protein